MKGAFTVIAGVASFTSAELDEASLLEALRTMVVDGGPWRIRDEIASIEGGEASTVDVAGTVGSANSTAVGASSAAFVAFDGGSFGVLLCS